MTCYRVIGCAATVERAAPADRGHYRASACSAASSVDVLPSMHHARHPHRLVGGGRNRRPQLIAAMMPPRLRLSIDLQPHRLDDRRPARELALDVAAIGFGIQAALRL